ncbi:MAG TPA: SAM-dependent chlorinase/fluorinase [Gemmatimonadales bacterium]|nr:SAM-dependent chlorinase/fluorinase [Gemmatimonadales bacterium]
MGPIITLLTDFGLTDSYVGELRATLLSQAHGALLVDVTHEIAPGDIRGAQYIFSRVWHRFPAGCVHLVVVDPGVGTDRRALAAASSGHFFVAPDNGLLSSLPGDARFVSLPIPPGAGATFHARDVFAPAAARLVIGTALTHLGPLISDPHRAPLPVSKSDGATLVGEVIYVDRFGTLITNIAGAHVAPGTLVCVAGRDVGPLRRTFGDVERGQLLAFVGSGETVEIAVRDGSATRLLGVAVGAEVRI